VRMWDSASGALIHEFMGHSDGILSVAFSMDGNFILSGGDNTMRLWSTGLAGRVTGDAVTPPR
jgi:WD40 repeat protein